MTGSLTSLPGRLLMHSQLWLPWQVFASHVDKSRCVKLHGSSLLQTKMANHGYAKIWEMHGNANPFFFFGNQWTSYLITPSIGSWLCPGLITLLIWSHGSVNCSAFTAGDPNNARITPWVEAQHWEISSSVHWAMSSFSLPHWMLAFEAFNGSIYTSLINIKV